LKIVVISDAHDKQVFLGKMKELWNESNYDAVFMLGDITIRVHTIIDFKN